MNDRTNKYYLTTAEMLVMRAIWLADHDLVLNEVVRDCNAAYGKDWKPQTVSTYLSHLVQKQFLRMDRNGKIYSYHPIVKAQDYMKYNVQFRGILGIISGRDDEKLSPDQGINKERTR